MDKKNFFPEQINKRANKIVDNSYEKNKHKTPFTQVAENAVKELGFKYNSTTGTFRNNAGKTLPMKEALEVTETLDKNFKDQKTDDYIKLANVPILNRDIKNIAKTNPTVLRYRNFKEDKKFREDFDNEYSDQAIRNHVRGKENKNRIAGKAPYENFSGSDVIVAEDAKDIARRKLKALQTPIKSNKDVEELSRDISLLEKSREESELLNNLKNNYKRTINQTEDDDTYKGLGSILNLSQMKK